MNDVSAGQDGAHVHQILEDDRMSLGHVQPFVGAGELVQEACALTETSISTPVGISS